MANNKTYSVAIEAPGVQLLDSDGDYNWTFLANEGVWLHERGVIKKTFAEVVRDHGPVAILVEEFTADDL